MNPTQRPNWKVAAAFGTLAGATVGGFVLAAPDGASVTPNELILDGGLASPARLSAPVTIALAQASAARPSEAAPQATGSASPPQPVVAPPAPIEADSAPSAVSPVSAASPVSVASPVSPVSAASPVSPVSAASPVSPASPASVGSTGSGS
jgi:hypothetical protein